jgi:hypothetical protein
VHPSLGRVTTSGSCVVTRWPQPDMGTIGATMQQRPSEAAACRKAARPGASQPSSFVKTKAGLLSLEAASFRSIAFS